MPLMRGKIFRVLFVLVVVALAAGVAQAQTGGTSRGGGSRAPKKSPRYIDHPVGEVFKGQPAPVRIDTRRARMFRTRLREDAREGPNFAGHYTVVFWGCGTGCAQLAVVDARNGRVFWPPLEYIDIPDREGDPGYRLDSRLLVLTRANYDVRQSYTAYFYLIDDNKGLRLIRRAEFDESNPIEK